MALTWNGKNMGDRWMKPFTGLSKEKKARLRESFGPLGKKHAGFITDYVIHYTVFLYMPDITEANVGIWCDRARLYDGLFECDVRLWWLGDEEVMRQFIGLHTNAGREMDTPAWFEKQWGFRAKEQKYPSLKELQGDWN